MDLDIKHDVDQKKFYAIIDNKEAYLCYEIVNDDTLDFWRTFVPENLRGQKIANQLLDHALMYAKQNHYKINPTCPYVKHIMEKYPTYQEWIK